MADKTTQKLPAPPGAINGLGDVMKEQAERQIEMAMFNAARAEEKASQGRKKLAGEIAREMAHAAEHAKRFWEKDRDLPFDPQKKPKFCASRYHYPPSHMVIRPFETYTHTCRDCGAVLEIKGLSDICGCSDGGG